MLLLSEGDNWQISCRAVAARRRLDRGLRSRLGQRVVSRERCAAGAWVDRNVPAEFSGDARGRNISGAVGLSVRLRVERLDGGCDGLGVRIRGLVSGILHRGEVARKSDGNQNAEDENDDEEFNERESFVCLVHFMTRIFGPGVEEIPY